MKNAPEVALVTAVGGDGAFARIARWLTEGFNAHGVSFDVVCIEGPAGVHRVGYGREIRLDTGYARKSVGALARYFREERPKATLVSPGFLAPYALIAGRLSGAIVLPWESSFLSFGLGDLPGRKRVIPWLQRRTYPWAPLTLAVSEDLCRHMVDAMNVSAERARVLPNPLNVSEIRSLAGRTELPTDVIRFCAVGRLNVHKAIDVLLQAATIVIRSSPPLRFEVVILGRGPHRPQLLTLSDELGVADVVRFVGHLTNPYEVMAGCHALVHPARREGFGLVIAEALAMGLPVIATTCPGGPKDILGGGDFGILVPPDDPEALAQAMLRLGRDAAVRRKMAQVGRERAEDYRPEHIASIVRQLVAEV